VCVLQRLAELTAELHEFVALDGAPVVPISAVTGAGMDSLRSTIATALRQPGITTAATTCAGHDIAVDAAATATNASDTATSDSTTAAVQQSGKKSKQKKGAAKHSSTSVQQQQQQCY
jgi:Fe2+ transport system protein B